MDSIIFDVDGTLWDSTDVVAKAWTDYLRQKEQIDLTITAGQLKTLFVANAFESDIQDCMDAGMDGHIAKPITMELLKEKLAK